MKRIAVLTFAMLTSFAFAATETISFDEAMKTILERSTAIRTQKETLDSTNARNLPSRLSLLPTLSGQATHAVSETFGERTTRRGLQGQANLNLFKFGADYSAMKAANADERAAEQELTDTILKTESEAVKALVGYIQAKQEVETVREIFQIREEALKIARERFNRGLLAAQEADKFAVDLDNSRARLSDTEISALAASADLEALLGHANVHLDWPWKTVMSEAAIPARDLSLRPDWQSAKEKVDAAAYRKDQAWGKVFPSLDLGFTYGYFRVEGPGGAPPHSPEWRGTLTLTVPIFDRLESFSSFRDLVHQRAIAELELEKVKRQAKSDFDTAKGTLEISLKTARLRDQTLGISRRLYRDNLERFRRGLVNANELVLDQDRLNDSQLNAIRGWGTAHTNFTRLCHAVGRRIADCLSQN